MRGYDMPPTHMAGVVPKSNDRLTPVVFITESTQARRAQQEVPAGRRFQPEPARAEHSQEMSTREKQHVPLHHAHAVHDMVSPGAHLLRRFTSRAAVAKQFPVCRSA